MDIRDNILDINGIDVCFGDNIILRDVTVSLGRGEIIGVVGESGSGKSTLIYSILGILGSNGRITRGNITYKNRDLLDVGERKMQEMRGTVFSLIAQNPVEYFHPIKRISTELREFVEAHGKLTYAEARERMLELLTKFHIHEPDRVLNSYAAELSGGMCQRTAIAMAMVHNPEVLLADEPTSALDVTVQKAVADELLHIRKDYNTAMIVVSHNMGVISYMADTIVVMYAGIVVESGNCKDVLRNPIHPYTQKLISVIPSFERRLPKGISVTNIDRTLRGCLYYNSCPNRCDRCRDENPEMVEVSSGHFVKCFM